MICPNCQIEHNKPKFCGNSCSASYNNKLRIRSQESKSKTSNTLKEKHRNGEVESIINAIKLLIPSGV